MEDGRASECYIERRGQRSVVGHVWKGRVENVLATDIEVRDAPEPHALPAAGGHSGAGVGALAFRDVALNHADKDVGIYASQLYLESLNVLASQVDPQHPACLTDMATDVPKFVQLYCTGGKEKTNAEQCGILIKINRDVERIALEGQVKTAATQSAIDAAKTYEKAGTGYMELWKKYGEGPCQNKEPACERNEVPEHLQSRPPGLFRMELNAKHIGAFRRGRKRRAVLRDGRACVGNGCSVGMREIRVRGVGNRCEKARLSRRHCIPADVRNLQPIAC